jgi:hypothetical protein
LLLSKTASPRPAAAAIDPNCHEGALGDPGERFPISLHS